MNAGGPPAGRAQRRPGAQTAQRLLDAAEKLVATYGEAGASSRAITQAAGQRHNSAIAYHFGGRRSLLDAVWARGSREVQVRRVQRRDGYGPGPLGLPELVDVYISPLADYMSSRQPSYWARFNEEALRRYPLVIPPHLRDELDRDPDEGPLHELLDIFSEMQQQVLDGRQPSAGVRVSAAVRGVISTLAAWEREAEKGTSTIDIADLGAELSATMVAALTAP